MQSIAIPLTPVQRLLLKPLFDTVQRAYNGSRPGAILAQIHAESFEPRFIPAEVLELAREAFARSPRVDVSSETPARRIRRVRLAARAVERCAARNGLSQLAARGLASLAATLARKGHRTPYTAVGELIGVINPPYSAHALVAQK